MGGDHGSPPPKGERGGGGKGKSGGSTGGSRGKVVEPPPGDEDSSRLDEQGVKNLKIKQKKKDKLEDLKNTLEDSSKMDEDLKNTQEHSLKMVVDPKKVNFSSSMKFECMEVDPGVQHGGGTTKGGGAHEANFPGSVQSLLARFGGAPKPVSHIGVQGGNIVPVEVTEGETDIESDASLNASKDQEDMDVELCHQQVNVEKVSNAQGARSSMHQTQHEKGKNSHLGAAWGRKNYTPVASINLGNSVDKMSKEAIGSGLGRTNAWKRPSYEQFDVIEPIQDVIGKDGVIEMDRGATEDNHRKLEKALVGKLFGRKFPFHFLNSELHKRWAQWGDFQLILAGEDCFICIFDSVDARDSILRGGPWFVAGQLIGMDKWTPNFSPKSLKGFSSPIWVRLLNLPLLYWDKKNIGRIASGIGEPLWMDSYTGSWGRSEYARVCVRVDFSKKLPSGVNIRGEGGVFFQQVAYEGISQICFHCGMVGHRDNACKEGCGTLKQVLGSVGINPSSTPNLHQVGNPSARSESYGNQQNTKQGGMTPLGGAEHAGSSSNPQPDSNRPEYGSWVVVTRRKNNKSKPSQSGGKLSARGTSIGHVIPSKLHKDSAHNKLGPSLLGAKAIETEATPSSTPSILHQQESSTIPQSHTTSEDLMEIPQHASMDCKNPTQPIHTRPDMDMPPRTHTPPTLAITAGIPTFKARSDGSSKWKKSSSSRSKERTSKSKHSKDRIPQALIAQELETLISEFAPLE